MQINHLKMALPHKEEFTPGTLFPRAVGTATCTFHAPVWGDRIG